MQLQAFNKLWVAIVGVALMWVNDKFGVDLTPFTQAIIDIGLTIGTPFFVWLVPNKGATSTTATT